MIALVSAWMGWQKTLPSRKNLQRVPQDLLIIEPRELLLICPCSALPDDRDAWRV